MASYYVWSGAAGGGTGADWANAFTTLTTAFVTEVAGDTLYVAHDHAESTATAITLTSSGTIANPTKIVCVNRAGSVPPVSADRRATAQVSTTLNSTINFAGAGVHYDGIIFNSGTGATGTCNILWGTNSSWTRFDNCSLRLNTTGASGRIAFGPLGALLELNNTTVSFANVGQQFTFNGAVKWRNTASALLGTIPTILFVSNPGLGGEVECIGVDFSAAGAGKNICSASNLTATAVKFRFTDCKLHASVNKSGAPQAPGAIEVDFVRCGSSGNYNMYSSRMAGLLIEETTIVRTGGASDGTTPISWNIASTANCTYGMPFECPPIAIWNDVTGSAVTATVEGIGAALPTDAEVWLDVEYLGDASSPQGFFVNDGKVDLIETAANQTSSSETWGGSTAAFKLAVTFTAQQKGWIYARVKIGKASSTFYIDPLVVLS